jgi:hypothetical protein
MGSQPGGLSICRDPRHTVGTSGDGNYQKTCASNTSISVTCTSVCVCVRASLVHTFSASLAARFSFKRASAWRASFSRWAMAAQWLAPTPPTRARDCPNGWEIMTLESDHVILRAYCIMQCMQVHLFVPYCLCSGTAVITQYAHSQRATQLYENSDNSFVTQNYDDGIRLCE